MNSMFTKIVRILLGIILIVFGLNKFIGFIPLPDLPEKAGAFMGSLGDTGYVLPFVGTLEIAIGVLLLLKKWPMACQLRVISATSSTDGSRPPRTRRR